MKKPPNTFVAKIDLALADKMKEDLLDQGFDLTKPPYTLFSGQKPGVSVSLYTSGKLVVQGKNKGDFITFYLEPEILKDLSYSHPETLIDQSPKIGIDEAGKGDFFGPLCIAGVYADETGVERLLALGVKDSKRMGDAKILPLASQIRSQFPHSIVRLYPEKYNELYAKFGNLNHMLAWGHSAAIEELVESTGCKDVLIDQFGHESLVKNALKKKGLDLSLTQRHYGESDPVVAAASILARAAFVEGIDKLSKSVGFELPKGANAGVIAAGRKLVERDGPQALGRVGKSHFKTRGDILKCF